MQGKEVPQPCTAIRLFSLCDAMRWTHLPQGGGLYDQNPELLEMFRYIFAERNKEQERQRLRDERKNNAANGSMSQQQLMRQASRAR